jgi:hypothetical protein
MTQPPDWWPDRDVIRRPPSKFDSTNCPSRVADESSPSAYITDPDSTEHVTE